MSYVVTFRGKPACPCLATWLPVFEQELKRRGVVKESIDIAQLIGGAAASGGTHSDGGAFDIWQHDDVTVQVSRQMGADATWARTTGSFANNRHTHGVLTGCIHNGPARYQIDEVRAGGDGLVGSTPDPGPRPLSGRTWQEGIAWANEQGDDMAEYGPQILEAITRLEDREQARDKAERERAQTRHQAILALLDKLADDIKDDASKAQVKRLRVAVEKLADPDA